MIDENNSNTDTTTSHPCGCVPLTCSMSGNNNNNSSRNETCCQCVHPRCPCRTTSLSSAIELSATTTAGVAPSNSSTSSPIHTAVNVLDIGVGGMTCSMCSSAVEKLLRGMDGIHRVSVSLSTNLARIEYYSNSPLTPQAIADEIELIGYDVTDIMEISNQSQQPAASTTAVAAAAVAIHPFTRTTRVVELAVGGMTCSMCSSAVQKL